MKIKYTRIDFNLGNKEKSVLEPHYPQQDYNFDLEVYFIQLKM